MAGRPRTGSIRARGRRFEASVKNPAGGRHWGYFADEESAGRWVAASLAALDQGLPVPDYRLYLPTVQTAVASDVPTGFAEVAWAWWTEQYVERTVEPGRRDDVKRILRRQIVPFFTQRVRNIDEVLSSHVIAFLRFLAGWAPTDPISEIRHPPMLMARYYTLGEIATLSGAHISMVKRASAEKKFANVVVKSKQLLVPAASVLEAGFGPESHRQTQVFPMVYSLRFAGEVLVILRGVIHFAQRTKVMTHDPSLDLKPVTDFNSLAPFSHPPRLDEEEALELSDSKLAAQTLNLHDQLVFWLQRLLACRISEAFGVCLSDIHDDPDEDWMVIHLQHQGGKRFEVRREDGAEVTVFRKRKMKTGAGKRVIPVPRQLAELIRMYIGAFHVETPVLEEDDEVALVIQNCDAQVSYRRHLKLAMASVGFTYQAKGFHPVPHLLRMSASAEIAENGSISHIVRSRFIGNKPQALDGAPQVTFRRYTPRSAGTIQFVPVVKTLSQAVEKKIGGVLVEPNNPDHLIGLVHESNPVFYEQAFEVLSAEGLIRGGDEGEGVTRVAAAETLSCSLTTVSKMVERGELQASMHQSVDGHWRHYITVQSIDVQLQLDRTYPRAYLVAQMLGIHQNDLKTLAHQAGIVAASLPGTFGIRYSMEEVELLRSRLNRKTTLAADVITTFIAAEKLGVSVSVVRRLIQSGDLVRDDVTSDLLGNGHVITRESLAELMVRRMMRSTGRRSASPGTIAIEVAAARLGVEPEFAVVVLQRAAVRMERSPDSKFRVFEDQFETYLERKKGGVGRNES